MQVPSQPLHVVVTGASRGIGEALAREYLGAGHRVTLVARSRERLEAIAAEAGPRARVVEADLAEADACTSWLPAAVDRLGPVDVLVNNAGMQLLGRVAELDPERIARMVALNVMAPVRLTRAVLPAMIARDAGTIVDIASLAALTPTPWMSHYSASKAFLATASECLRAELAGTKVHVLTVYPGPVATAMADKAVRAFESSLALDSMPTGTPESLAKVIVRAVEKRRQRVIYPKIYTAATVLPALARWVTRTMAPKPIDQENRQKP